MMPASPASEVMYENLHVTRVERAFAQVRSLESGILLCMRGYMQNNLSNLRGRKLFLPPPSHPARPCLFTVEYIDPVNIAFDIYILFCDKYHVKLLYIFINIVFDIWLPRSVTWHIPDGIFNHCKIRELFHEHAMLNL